MKQDMFDRYESEMSRAANERAKREAEILRRVSARNFRKTPIIPDWEVGPGFAAVSSIIVGLALGLIVASLAVDAWQNVNEALRQFQQLRIEK